MLVRKIRFAAAIAAGLGGVCCSCVFGDMWVTGYMYQPEAYSVNLAAGQLPWSKYTTVIHGGIYPAAGSNVDIYSGYIGYATPLNGYTTTYAQDFTAAAHDPVNQKKGLVSLIIGKDQSSWMTTDTAAANVNTFATALAKVVTNNGYDGIDLDWEYGMDSGSLGRLVTSLRAKLPSSSQITLAINANLAPTVYQSGVVNQINQINLMCYQWAAYSYDNVTPTKTALCTSLLKGNGVTLGGYGNARSVEEEVWRTEQAGISAGKIGILLPSFAQIQNIPGVTSPGQAYPGGANASAYPAPTFNDAYFLDSTSKYSKYWTGADYGVTVTVNGLQVTKIWDSNHEAPYISVVDPANPANDQFISFSDARQIQLAEAWAQANGLGGFGTFAFSEEYNPQGLTTGAQFPISAAIGVPEPASLSLLILGTAGILARRRK